MSVIKKEIQYKGQTAYINFNLKSNSKFLDYQQNIDNITQFNSLDIVNDGIDDEKRKFSHYSDNGSSTLKFYFLNPYNEYENSFESAGFTTIDITGKSESILNSFIIADFYDTTDIAKQKRLFTTYLTKLVYKTTVPTYFLSIISTDEDINQLYYMYISRSYINQQTTSIITGYTKFSFFSGIDGIIKTFQYIDEPHDSTEEKLFLKTELNFTGRTWQFITTSRTINLRQLRGVEYDTRMSETFNKEGLVKPNYSKNTIFDYRTGKYVSHVT